MNDALLLSNAKKSTEVPHAPPGGGLPIRLIRRYKLFLGSALLALHKI